MCLGEAKGNGYINMKQVLPLEYPTITSYPGRAYCYAIMEKDIRIYPWLMENFIQTESFLDLEKFWCDIDFFIPPRLRYSSNMAHEAQNAFCPYIDNFSINSEIIDFDQLIDFIKKGLLQQYYIVADVNTYFIPAYANMNQQLHDMLIYGFDDSKEIFFIADFLRDQKYGVATCSYTELSNAIEHFEDSAWEYYPSGKSKLSLLRVSPLTNCSFNYKKFKNSLDEYLGISHFHKQIYVSTNHFNTSENEKRVFGINHYNNLVEYLKYSLEAHKLIYNQRVFHVFYDHKKSLMQRIDYLSRNGLDCDYEKKYFEEVVTNSLLIRNIYLKCLVKESAKDYNIICTKLQTLKKVEFEILVNISAKIDKL